MQNALQTPYGGFVNSAVTALFTKPPAEPFPALPGTIPENAMKLSMGNSL